MKPRRSHKVLAVWALLILCFWGIYQLLSREDAPKDSLSFSEFLHQVEEGEVKEVKITLTSQGKAGTFEGRLADDRGFETTGVLSDGLLASLQEHNIVFEIVPAPPRGFWRSVFFIWVPMVFLIGIFLFFMRQLQVGGGKVMGFRKAQAKLMDDAKTKVTFSDVAGVDEAKDEVHEIIEFLQEPTRFTRLGGRIPKGVLLVGPPGTGKTLIARAIAGEASVPFFSISASEFVEMFVGVGATRVRDLFEQGVKNAPCILFIDEIDAVGRHRGAGLGGGHDEREQTLNQLLVEMDGFESNDGVILIAATNRPDVLDPALLRPGRFDRRIIVPRPDVQGREEILQIHTRKTPLDFDVDLGMLARGTPGFSGADLESMVNEAALLAAHADQDQLSMGDFERSKDKILMGRERKSTVMQEQEQRRIAIHEAGHALVANLTPGVDPVHKVTIVPRGRTLGLTQQLPLHDSYSVNKQAVLGDIAVLMGGRAAEETVLGTLSTGADDDIEQATALARKMVCEWGMSDALGPVAFGKKESPVFLGRELGMKTEYSEQTAIVIDTEIHQIVRQQCERCMRILREHRRELDRVVEALLEHETLTGADLDGIMEGTPIQRPPPEPRHLLTPEDARNRQREESHPKKGPEPEQRDGSQA